MTNKKASKTPFGILHLVDVTEEEQKQVNGGRHRRHHGISYVTNFVSAPQPAFPKGDHG
jgi:hypothetical protein